MFSRVGMMAARAAVPAAARAGAVVPRVAVRAAPRVPRVAARRAMSDAAAGDSAAAGGKPKGFMANLPRDPNYEGFEGVVRYYLPTNDKFVMWVVSNYVVVIGFVMWKNNRAAEEEARKAPPPAYPEFAKELAKLQ